MVSLNFDYSALMTAYGQYFIIGIIILILVITGIVKLIKRRKGKMLNSIEQEALSEKARQIWTQLQDFERKEQEEVKRLQERFKAEKKLLQDKYDYLYDKLGWRQ